MALGLTQPLTEMSTRIISGGTGGQCVRLTILPPSRADCLEIWEPQPPGTVRACPGPLWDCFTFITDLYINIYIKGSYVGTMTICPSVHL